MNVEYSENTTNYAGKAETEANIPRGQAQGETGDKDWFKDWVPNQAQV